MMGSAELSGGTCTVRSDISWNPALWTAEDIRNLVRKQVTD